MRLEMFQTVRECGEGTDTKATGPRLLSAIVFAFGRDRFALAPFADPMDPVEVGDHVAPSLAREPSSPLRFAFIHVMTVEVTVIWVGDTAECTHESIICQIKPPAIHTNIRFFMFFFLSSPVVFVLVTMRFVSKTASTPIPAVLVRVAFAITWWNVNLGHHSRSKNTEPTYILGFVDPTENHQVVIPL